MSSAGARQLVSKVFWNRSRSSSSRRWPLTVAALLTMMSIWKRPLLVKWPLAASTTCWGPSSVLRSAWTVRALTPYLDSKSLARACALAVEPSVA